MKLFRRKDRVKRDYSALLERPQQPVPERTEPLILRERYTGSVSAPHRQEPASALPPAPLVREPYEDRIHREELAALDERLRSLMNGETAHELEGQRALVTRLKTNLKDNRSKLRRTLRDLKSMRKKVEAQRNSLFEKCLTIDRQNAELRDLRARPFLAAPRQSAQVTQSIQRLQDKLSQTQTTLDSVLAENRNLKTELAVIRKQDAERSSEMALLRSEHQTMTENQSALLTQIADLQAIAAQKAEAEPQILGTGAAGFVQIKELNRALTEAKEREAVMQQRLEILKRDLDIVGQINTMLRGRVEELESPSKGYQQPFRVAG